MKNKKNLFNKIKNGSNSRTENLKKELTEFIKLAKQIIQEGKKEIDEIKKSKKYYKQIPNILTASRAIAPLVILGLIIAQISPLVIILTTAGFAFTDFLDGKLARLLKAESTLGISLDQFCDKVMAGGLILVFLPFNPIIAINLLLELVIAKTAINSSLETGNNKSKMIGRIKTCFLFPTIIGAYANAHNIIPNELFTLLFTSSTILQGMSINSYHKSRKKHIDIDEDSAVKIDNEDSQVVNTKKTVKEHIQELESLKQEALNNKEVFNKEVFNKEDITNKEEIKQPVIEESQSKTTEGHVKTIRKI